MAEVQYATRRGDSADNIIALKRILPQYSKDASFRRFFAAESELSRCLHHPNVVEAVDAGEVNGVPYLAMEYIHGRALNRVMYTVGTQRKRLPIPHAVFIGIKALEGLHYVHRAQDSSGKELNVVLCDISPSNIMIGYDGQVKLIDFGIATSRIKFFEQIGMLKGKKNYMAPEQLRGLPLDHRADIFAMGICLFELFTCESVFAGQSEFEIEEAVRSGRLPSLADRAPHVSAELRAVVETALRLDPAQRYGSAQEFALALKPFARMGRGAEVTATEVSKILRLYVTAIAQQDDKRLAEVLSRISGAHAQSADIVDDDSDLDVPTGNTRDAGLSAKTAPLPTKNQ